MQTKLKILHTQLVIFLHLLLSCKLEHERGIQGHKKNEPYRTRLHFGLRRERDSNPRSLSAQRFSRPPQSTTLPSLLRRNALVA